MLADHLPIEEQLRRSALVECRLDPARPLVVGFSGGADSLTLLGGLNRLGFQVTAAHFDHHLRANSGEDARRAEALAAAMGAAWVQGEGQAADYAKTEGLSIEAAARVLRYHFLFEQARQLEAQAVAVGHTADDQVETLLLHLLRGSGLTGLRGMAYRGINPAWDGKIPLARPLLGVWREATEAWCREQRLEPVEDPSNRESVYLRNRVRLELLPHMASINPEVKRALWRTAFTLAGDFDVLEVVTGQAWQLTWRESGPGWAAFDTAAFAALEPALQRGVLRRGWPVQDEDNLEGLRDVDLAAVEQARRFILQPPRSGRADLAGGVWLQVEGSRFILRRETATLTSDGWPQVGKGEVLSLAGPETVYLPGGWRLAVEWCDDLAAAQSRAAQAAGTPFEAWLDAQTAPFPLKIRAVLPGERWQPLGMPAGTQKLSDFFTNEKLPQRARALWPLVIAAERVVWVPGYRPAHHARLKPETRRVFHLALFREPDAAE